jgi:hypothetical protein
VVRPNERRWNPLLCGSLRLNVPIAGARATSLARTVGRRTNPGSRISDQRQPSGGDRAPVSAPFPTFARIERGIEPLQHVGRSIVWNIVQTPLNSQCRSAWLIKRKIVHFSCSFLGPKYHQRLRISLTIRYQVFSYSVVKASMSPRDRLHACSVNWAL